MLKPHQMTILMCILAVAVRARAMESTPVKQQPSSATTVKPIAPWLSGPEIWRLPPVVAARPTAPAALQLPPPEPIPAPVGTPLPPTANAPASLSGVLSGAEPLEIGPPPAKEPRPWSGSFDLGLDGSEGNSETLNFRFGFHAARKVESNALTLGLDYNKSTVKTQNTVNRLYFDGRFEWLFHDSRWSWSVHETIEYDEFQPFNVRDTSDAGLGYRLIKTENTTFIGRFGGGFSHYYGGPQDGQYIPELVFGTQLEHHINQRQKFLGAVEYAPDVGNFLYYRIRAQAAWELLLDMDRNLSLRLGVLERYNSVPNNAKPNDLDYAMTLLWKF